nr:MAG TPA: hypothetical protein [Caudoviricetes sp.]
MSLHLARFFYYSKNDYVIDYVFIYLSNIQPYLKYSKIN